MNVIGNLNILKFTVFAFTTVIVGADECSKICGQMVPETSQRVRSCFVQGFARNITDRIDWSDRSFSEYSVSLVTQFVFGSCCSNFIYTQYGNGIVTDGRFSGEPITYVETFRTDQTAECNNGCETNSGLTSVSGPMLVTIGTKGVGQWIECIGTHTVLFSPPLTSQSQLVSVTDSAQFPDCNNCVESC